jgi:molybdate transport system ATP-binding protein
MSQKPFFSLAGISLRVDSQIVFRDTYWAFGKEEHWAILGPNGSGKTLLAKAIAGEAPMVAGEIHYNFRVPAGKIPEDFIALVSFEKQKALAGDAPPASRWFSLDQEDALSVDQFISQDSVEEINPFEVTNRTPESEIDFARRHRSVVRQLGIQNLIGQRIPSLSNGEMRKILLARALLKNPRLLIVEDVFTGLDAGYRAHLKSILERLMHRGKTRFLLTTAEPEALPDGITHILLVDQCQVVTQGTRSEVLHRAPRSMQQISASVLSQRFVASLGASRQRCGDDKSVPGVDFLNSVLLNGRNQCQVRMVQGFEPGAAELIRMQNVSVRYDGREILSGINWVVRRGESWALIGPNGSGKSTLLSLVNADNPQAYANRICLFGRPRGSGESVWDIRKKIGEISPEMHLHFTESQNCLETVLSGFHDSYGLYKRTSSAQREAAQKLLALFGLSQASRSPFQSLSAGLQRMILLARALVKKPALLLLDEPCQGLDSAHRAMFLGITEWLIRRTDTTVIYVTHRANEIPKGVRRVLRLQDGRIVKTELMSARKMHRVAPKTRRGMN